MVYPRWCFVPMCHNNSKTTPNKLFFTVPCDPKARKKWMKAANRAGPISKTHLNCCEDHFDVPNDMANYMQYHLLGSVSMARLKPNCLPSKFACQPDRKQRTTTMPRAAYLKRQRKEIIEQLLEEQKETEEKETEEAETEEAEEEAAMDNTRLSRTSITAFRAKVTAAQADVLSKFFEENPEVIKGYKQTPENRRKVKDKWIKITPHLNSLGAERNHKAWAKYLNDVKTRLKKQRVEWKETSDGPVVCDAEDYSQLKLRMLRVLGKDHTVAQNGPNTRLDEISIDFIEDNSNYEEECEDTEDVHGNDECEIEEKMEAITSDNSISSEQQSSHIFMNDTGYGDEFEWFGKNVAQQLRTLPLQVALETQELVLSVIRKQRLEVLNNSNHCDPLGK